jgi:hypothetical protein
MGRYDALTQLEEKPVQADPLPAVAPSPTDSSQAQAINKQDAGQKKPAKPQNRKTASQSPSNAAERPEKYTTRLEPSLVKKIRLHAAEKEMKDYEVVRTALNHYFERNN